LTKALVGDNSDFFSGGLGSFGFFLNAVISFLILAAILYFLVILPVNALMDRFKPAPDEPTPTKDCTECLSSIPVAAHKCAFCTSVQTG
jgi:large conductance mechanosensitive channel